MSESCQYISLSILSVHCFSFPRKGCGGNQYKSIGYALLSREINNIFDDKVEQSSLLSLTFVRQELKRKQNSPGGGFMRNNLSKTAKDLHRWPENHRDVTNKRKIKTQTKIAIGARHGRQHVVTDTLCWLTRYK